MYQSVFALTDPCDGGRFLQIDPPIMTVDVDFNTDNLKERGDEAKRLNRDNSKSGIEQQNFYHRCQKMKKCAQIG